MMGDDPKCMPLPRNLTRGEHYLLGRSAFRELDFQIRRETAIRGAAAAIGMTGLYWQTSGRDVRNPRR